MGQLAMCEPFLLELSSLSASVGVAGTCLNGSSSMPVTLAYSSCLMPSAGTSPIQQPAMHKRTSLAMPHVVSMP